jgi:hypothetical protein
MPQWPRLRPLATPMRLAGAFVRAALTAGPFKGGTFETADTGQIIKARIDSCREERPIGWSHPFFQVTATEI